MIPAPRVLVGILSYESPDETIAAAEALRHSSYSDFDIIVVDNASPSGCARLIADACPWLTVETNPTNGGYSAGMNSILCRALKRGYKYALLCNNDIVVDANALSFLVATAEADDRAALVGGISVSYQTAKIGVVGGKAYGLIRGRVQWSQSLPSTGYVKEVSIVQGALVLFRVDAYAAGLKMDERLFMYFEEPDLAYKMRRMGLRGLVDARVTVRHRGEDRFLVARNAYLQQRNRVYLVRVHGNRLQYLLHILLVGLFELPLKVSMRLLQRRSQFARACIVGFAHGVRGRMGIGAFMSFDGP